MNTRSLLCIASIVAMSVLSGCVAGTSYFAGEQTAGFFSGILHGWIAPFILIAKVFGVNVDLYEVNNNGIWYDIGFYIAIIGGFGSISLTRKKFRGRK